MLWLQGLVLLFASPVVTDDILNNKNIGNRAKACKGLAFWAYKKLSKVPFNHTSSKNTGTMEAKIFE